LTIRCQIDTILVGLIHEVEAVLLSASHECDLLNLNLSWLVIIRVETLAGYLIDIMPLLFLGQVQAQVSRKIPAASTEIGKILQSISICQALEVSGSYTY